MTHMLRALGGWTLALCLSSPAPLPAEIAVTGRLTDEHQRPLAGAEVRLVPVPTAHERGLALFTGTPDPAAVARASTDAAGGYRIVAPGPGLWRIELSAPGFLPMQRIVALVEGRELEHVVAPEATEATEATVRVRFPDGRPAAGALVLADTVSLSDPTRWFEATTCAVTDERGEARLPVASGQTGTLRAYAPGFAPAEAGVAGPVVELALGAAPPVTVEVRDEHGRPAAGVLLSIGELPWPLGTTDASGRAVIALPAGGAVSLTALAADHRSARAEVSSATAGEGPITLRLEPPRRYAGILVDYRTGAPLAGALVATTPVIGISVRSNARGAFTLDLPAVEAVHALTAGARAYFEARLPRRSLGDARALRLALARRGAVEGRVVDETGRPVAAAELEIEITGGSERALFLGEGEMAGGESAADGSFSLPAAAALPYRLAVTKDGYAPREQDVEPGKRVTVVLSRGGAVLGRLVTPDRRPVAGGRVLLSIFDAEMSEWEEPAFSRFAESNARGMFVLPHLAPGTYRLRAAAPRSPASPWRTVQLASTGEEVDVGELVGEPGIGLAGRVVDERDRPVAGVRVLAEEEPSLSAMLLGDDEEPHDAGDWTGRRDEPTTTDAEGRFELGGFRQGARLWLGVDDPDHVLERPAVVELPAAEPVELRVFSRATVRGRVVDRRGSPVREAMITFSGDASEARPARLYRPSRSRGLVVTDELGRFELAGVDPGEVRIQARASGFPPAVLSLTVEPASVVTDALLVLEDGAVLEGRVLDENGRGVPVLTVEAHRSEARAPGSARSWGSAETDASGAFRIAGLAPGSFVVMASDPAHGSARETVELGAGGGRVELVLRRGLLVRGTVLDEAGRAVPHASVVLQSSSPKNPSGYGAGTSDLDGMFEVDGLAAGTYHLRAHKGGAGATAAALVVDLTGGSVDGVRVVLRPGSRLRGRVLGLEPEDWPRVLVRAFATARGGERQSPLDELGGFTFSDLEPGPWVLIVTEGRTGRSATKALTIEGPETEVEIELGAADAVVGWLRFEGRPVAGAMVALGEKGLGEPSLFATTGPDGRFEVQGVPAGLYSMMVVMLPRPVPVRREIELAPGREHLVDLRLAPLAGRLVDALSGGPVAGARLWLLPDLGPARSSFSRDKSLASGRGDDDGRFALVAQIEGPYYLAVEAAGYAPLELPVTLTPGGVEMVIPLARADP